MIKTYTIYEGTKATIDGKQFSFDCEPDDIDTAYDALAENVQLNNQDQDDSRDLVDFENAADDDVQTLLDDMKRMGFIGEWEASNPIEGSYKMVMTYKVSEGTKVSLDGGQLVFQCEPNEVGAAYDALYESIVLMDKNGYFIPDGPFSLGRCYLEDIGRASLKPKYVAEFLNDLKKMGFIGEWGVIGINELEY